MAFAAFSVQSVKEWMYTEQVQREQRVRPGVGSSIFEF